MHRLKELLPTRQGAVLLAAAVLLGAGSAVAANTIDSSDIVNNSVKSKDLKDNGVKSKDVRDETLQTVDLSQAARDDLQGQTAKTAKTAKMASRCTRTPSGGSSPATTSVRQ